MTRRRLAAVLLGLVLVAGTLAGLAVRAALQAADLAQQARVELDGVRDEGADLDALRAATARSGALLDRAAQALDAPAPRLVAAVPLVGRSWRAERAVVQAARSTVAATALLGERAQPLRSAGGRLDPTVVAALAQDLREPYERARDDLRALRAVDVRATPPVVQRAVRESVAGLQPVVTALGQSRDGAQLAAGILRGPRRVLVALMNNAELRGAGGYAASFATGTVAQGRLSLRPFRDVTEVNDPPAQARRVPAPEEYRQDYGPFLADTTLWQNWTMSPHVPDTALVGARVAGRLLGEAPDLVLLLDVPALAALVELSGTPVVLDGRPVTGDDLVQVLLTDTYARAEASPGGQTARREALQAAASSAVAGLLGGLSPTRLAPRAAELAAGRHLAVWSRVPREQAALRQLGLAGGVGVGCEDLALVSVNNLNSNKLDYYVDRQVSVRAHVGPREAQVVQRVRLENRAPRGLVPYVDGLTEPGVARERVELSLGPRAEVSAVTQDGRAVPHSVRRSADRTRVATYLRLRRGRPVTVEVRYRLPREGDAYRLHLVPQPLARDALLTVDLVPVDGFTAAPVREVGPLSRVRLVEMAPAPRARASWRERLRRFWDEPVRL